MNMLNEKGGIAREYIADGLAEVAAAEGLGTVPEELIDDIASYLSGPFDVPQAWNNEGVNAGILKMAMMWFVGRERGRTEGDTEQ